MTYQDGWLLSSIRTISKSLALASLVVLLTSCILLDFTLLMMEEDPSKESEITERLFNRLLPGHKNLDAYFSDEEFEWDAKTILKNLHSERIAMETGQRRRHSHILSKQVLNNDDEREVKNFLTQVLYFSRTVAEMKPVIEMFSISLTPSNTIISSTAGTAILLQELDRVFIELDPDQESKAFAFYNSSGTLRPRISLSLGMLRELIQSGSDEFEERLAQIISLEQDITNLPERNGLKVSRNTNRYIGRYMDLAIGGIGTQVAHYEYAASVIFTVAHELAHATYDRFNPPLHTREWTEIRADLFGVFVTEILMREAQTKNSATADVLKGGFHTDDPDKIANLASDAGYQIFLKVYNNTSFAKGDESHLPIEKRKELLESAYKVMFKKEFYK